MFKKTSHYVQNLYGMIWREIIVVYLPLSNLNLDLFLLGFIALVPLRKPRPGGMVRDDGSAGRCSFYLPE